MTLNTSILKPDQIKDALKRIGAALIPQGILRGGLLLDNSYFKGTGLKKGDKYGFVWKKDAAMRTISGPGGIDLNPTDKALQVQAQDGEIIFDIDPVMLEKFRNAPGFVPVIINIQPLTDLPAFLGVS